MNILKGFESLTGRPREAVLRAACQKQARTDALRILLLLQLMLGWTCFHCCPRNSFLVSQPLPAERPAVTSVSWDLQFPFPFPNPRLVCLIERVSLSGPHDLLAAREAGDLGKGAATTTTHEVGNSLNTEPGIRCYWAAKAGDQSISNLWFIGIILKPDCTAESPGGRGGGWGGL